MADLGELLQVTMRCRDMTAQALAEQTGIRVPRIKAFLEDGARGPVLPTEQELSEMAAALRLPPADVMDAARPRVRTMA